MRRKFLAIVTACTLASVCLSGCSLTNALVKESEEQIEQTKENLAEETAELSEDIDKLAEDVLNAFAETEEETVEPTQEEIDQMKADEVAALIDGIYVQERTADTDAQCEAQSTGSAFHTV